MAGTYAFEVGEEIVTGWHVHDLHQLEYAFEGVAQVETATAPVPPAAAAGRLDPSRRSNTVRR